MRGKNNLQNSMSEIDRPICVKLFALILANGHQRLNIIVHTECIVWATFAIRIDSVSENVLQMR